MDKTTINTINEDSQEELEFIFDLIVRIKYYNKLSYDNYFTVAKLNNLKNY